MPSGDVSPASLISKELGTIGCMDFICSLPNVASGAETHKAQHCAGPGPGVGERTPHAASFHSSCSSCLTSFLRRAGPGPRVRDISKCHYASPLECSRHLRCDKFTPGLTIPLLVLEQDLTCTDIFVLPSGQAGKLAWPSRLTCLPSQVPESCWTQSLSGLFAFSLAFQAITMMPRA